MKEIEISDAEFDWLGYALFTIDADEPEDWEEFNFDEDTLELYNILHNIHLERKKLLEQEDRSIDDKIDKTWKLYLTEDQIEIILDINKDTLIMYFEDSDYPNFEYDLRLANCLLKKLSRPELTLQDIKR